MARPKNYLQSPRSVAFAKQQFKVRHQAELNPADGADDLRQELGRLEDLLGDREGPFPAHLGQKGFGLWMGSLLQPAVAKGAITADLMFGASLSSVHVT